MLKYKCIRNRKVLKEEEKTLLTVCDPKLFIKKNVSQYTDAPPALSFSMLSGP